MEDQVNAPAVKRFVREVVGCNCPDEVFNRVEVRRGSSAVKSCSADYEIDVGGRLLLVVASEPAESLTPALLEKVMAEGRTARNSGKFNRFRLIVQSDNAAQVQQKLQAVLERLATKDEKLHVHVIGTKDVPDFLVRGDQRAKSS